MHPLDQLKANLITVVIAVLPLFKIKYPEINSENFWNFTKYPEIVQKVPVFYGPVANQTNQTQNYF